MKVAVIGAGSWGTALAIKAAQVCDHVSLYQRHAEKAALMEETRHNPEYVTEAVLPMNIRIQSDLAAVLADAEIVLVVTPSQFVRETLAKMKPYITNTMKIVACSKGLERATGKRMSEVMAEELGDKTTHFAILSGPNHAEEIAMNRPAATVVGCADEEDAREIVSALHSDTFRVYINTDITGVELCGTTKNIIALAAGIEKGLDLGDNAVSALITRGLHEMTTFGLAYGAQRETYAGLAGMGDLVATCMSKNSRNRSAGLLLAKGYSMADVLAQTKQVVEGFTAVLTVYEEAQRRQIEMPVTEALYHVLQGEWTIEEAVKFLLQRDFKNETNIT